MSPESQDPLSSLLVPSVRITGTTGRRGVISANFGVCTLIRFQAEAHGQWNEECVCTWVGSGLSCVFTVIGCSHACGSLAVGVEEIPG